MISTVDPPDHDEDNVVVQLHYEVSAKAYNLTMKALTGPPGPKQSGNWENVPDRGTSDGTDPATPHYRITFPRPTRINLAKVPITERLNNIVGASLIKLLWEAELAALEQSQPSPTPVPSPPPPVPTPMHDSNFEFEFEAKADRRVRIQVSAGQPTVR